MDQWLETHWYDLVKKYSADVAIVKRCFIEIENAYNSSSRHYHNLQHIYSLLQLAEKHHELLVNRIVVDLSIYYHDIIYDALKNDNEERSATFADNRLGELNVPENIISEVKIYIKATKTHKTTAAKNISDLSFFLDFDLSILGADWNKYQEYCRQLREEYVAYPDVQYKKGRREFLSNLLASKYIFNTHEFREQVEVQARENMQKELDLILNE